MKRILIAITTAFETGAQAQQQVRVSISTGGEATNMTLENQTIGATAVPWHPGAVRYFADRGIQVK